MALIKCPYCRKGIDPRATKCSHCQSPLDDEKSKALLDKQIKGNRNGALGCLAVVAVVVAIIMISNSGDKNTAPSTPTLGIGEQAYLRLPSTTDPEQVICLGKTKEDYQKISKALAAKDVMGVLEIPGAYCVSNGTQVQVIDVSVTMRQVRIIKGVRDVDADKVGRSGWVAVEWVVK